jgi:hypothetical protein
MKALRSCQFAASCQPKAGDPVAGRWPLAAGSAMAMMCSTVAAPIASPSSSPFIRHSDELYCSTG